MALPERVDVAYENEHYNPKLQYLTGVARDDASYMICKCFHKEGHFWRKIFLNRSSMFN